MCVITQRPIIVLDIPFISNLLFRDLGLALTSY